MDAHFYYPSPYVSTPSAAFLGCICRGTGRVPRPPQGEPPFQQFYLQEIPCPECAARADDRIFESAVHADAAILQGRIAFYLNGLRFHFRNEEELQDGIEQALLRMRYDVDVEHCRKEGWRPVALAQFKREEIRREVVLGPHDRIDFLLPHGVGIEVKVAGSADAAMRQLSRYAAHEEIRALILVTDRVQAGVQPDAVNGKSIRVVMLMGGLR